MSAPAISIVIPCFNAERHIRNGIASALGQGYRDLELIVVDDGSTDGLQAVLTELQNSRLVLVRQEHRGVSAARNVGLTRAAGRYVAFLDADDAWDPRCLEKLLAALEAAPEAALAYCGWQMVGLPGGRGKPYIPPDYERERKLEYLLAGCPWPIHAALTRRDAVEAAGGFDEGLTNSEDHAMWLRVAAFHPIVRVPEVLAYYNFHSGEQASKNRAKAARYQWLVQREFLKEHPEVAERVGRQRIRELTLGGLLTKGYGFFWKRQLPWARETFRLVLRSGGWRARDLPYLLLALLPLGVYTKVVRMVDRWSAEKGDTSESDQGLEA